MKETAIGFMQQVKDRTRKFTAPLIVGTAMSLSPININNDYSIDSTPSIAYMAEKETPAQMYKKLSAEYGRLYNSNYAMTSSEAIIKDEAGETVATNGVSITHKYDSATGKWEKLSENLPYATPEVRMKFTLNSILKMNYYLNKPDGSQVKIPNPLTISEDDVETYLRTGSDKDLKSFQIINNSKGEPSLVLVTNPSSGLHEGNKSVQGVKKAFDFLNKIDPNFVDRMSQQFYVRAISGDFADTGLRAGEYDSGATPTVNTVCLNGDLVKDNYLLHTLGLLNQSRSVYLWKHVAIREGKYETYVADRLNDNNFLDRFTFAKKWIETNKSKMTKNEYETIMLYTNRTIENYLKSKSK